MTRKHTAALGSFEHHERAVTAARVARVMRRAMAPARLYLIAVQVAPWDQLIWLLALAQEVTGRELARAHRRHMRLTNKATQIQGELA